MVRYIIRRCLGMVPMLFLISLSVFFFMHAAAGNAIDAIINPHLQNTSGMLAHDYQMNGINRPLLLQYWLWLKQVAEGDWGFSFTYHEPVSILLFPALKNTCILALFAEGFCLLLSLPIGFYQAKYANRMFDRVVHFGTLLLFVLPYFFIALILIELFTIHWPLFPYQNRQITDTGFERVFAHLQQIFLPAVSMVLSNLAVYSQTVRNAILGEIHQDYTRTALAKGLSQNVMVRKHVLQNALIPLFTMFGLDIGTLMAGDVILEGLFGYPGMGNLLLLSAEQRDYPVLMATTIWVAMAVLCGNFLSDILYTLVDPKFRDVILEGTN